jgi:hypothetical protein
MFLLVYGCRWLFSHFDSICEQGSEHEAGARKPARKAR